MKQALKSAFLAVVILLMSISVVAIPEINLRGPSNGATTESYRVEFSYAFSAVPSDISECTLYVDGAQAAQRQNLFSYDNNKISTELVEGAHTWFIRCSDSSGAQSTSDTRTITVSSAVASEEGFETIYTNTGSRIHVLSLIQGGDAIALPAMKTGDSIRVKTPKTTYDFDLVKMSAIEGKSFVELRNKKAYTLHKVFVEENLDVDLDADNVTDVSFFLEKINRGVDAFIIVQPYPGNVPAEEAPEEPAAETPEVTPVETETPVEEEPATETPVETPATSTPDEAEVPVVATTETKRFNWLIPLLVLIVLAAVGGLAYFLMNKKPSAKKEVKHNKKEADKKVESHKENHSKADSKSEESFDVIKSNTSGKKK